MPRIPAPAEETGERSSAVEKALRIIEAVVESSTPINMSAIERATGLPRPTAHRVTNGLIDAGYLERDQRQRGHAPGPRLMALAYQLLRNGTPRSRRLDVLNALARETGEACHFALLRGRVVHLLDQVASPGPLSVHYDDEGTLPLHAVACGKLMLAYQPDAQRDILLSSYTLTRLTERTVTDRRRLVASLKEIRDAGCCVEEGEHVDGIVTMAVPVMANGGALFGALGLAIPHVRFGPSQAKRLSSPLRQAATQLSTIFN